MIIKAIEIGSLKTAPFLSLFSLLLLIKVAPHLVHFLSPFLTSELQFEQRIISLPQNHYSSALHPI